MCFGFGAKPGPIFIFKCIQLQVFGYEVSVEFKLPVIDVDKFPAGGALDQSPVEFH
jgi:hypothetical protein